MDYDWSLTLASLSFQDGSRFILTKPVEDRPEKDSKRNGADLGGALSRPPPNGQ